MHQILPKPVGYGRPIATYVTGRRGGGSSSGGSASFPYGVGSPEGSVTADPGTTYVQTDTGRLWLKTLGTGNTGWEAQPKATVGTGSPEGVVVGRPGDRFVATDLSTQYTKATGVETNTGWL